MFSMKNYKAKREIYICAFTTIGPIKNQMLHQLWVRALSRDEAIGICMSYAWKHSTHIEMFKSDTVVNGIDFVSEGLIETSGIMYGDDKTNVPDKGA